MCQNLASYQKLNELIAIALRATADRREQRLFVLLAPKAVPDRSQLLGPQERSWQNSGRIAHPDETFRDPRTYRLANLRGKGGKGEERQGRKGKGLAQPVAGPRVESPEELGPFRALRGGLAIA